MNMTPPASWTDRAPSSGPPTAGPSDVGPCNSPVHPVSILLYQDDALQASFDLTLAMTPLCEKHLLWWVSRCSHQSVAVGGDVADSVDPDVVGSCASSSVAA